jgi:hypothetical protein
MHRKKEAELLEQEQMRMKAYADKHVQRYKKGPRSQLEWAECRRTIMYF